MGKLVRLPLCVICWSRIVGRGNNAQPVREGRCCDRCNWTVVLPARTQAG